MYLKKKNAVQCCFEQGCMFVSYRLVHLELCIALAEQFIRPRRSELFSRMSQKQKVVEEESPEFFVALYLVHLKRNK